MICPSNRIVVHADTPRSVGKGSNQAVAASRLGREVSIIGCIGRDMFGERGVKMLNET